LAVPDSPEALPRAFFDRPPLEVAAGLLGMVVVGSDAGGLVAIRLTEVEAYHGEHDPGSHAYRGPTRRNAVMFGPPGHVYVYQHLGLHHCMNLVCGPAGQAAAVLLRAGEVVRGRSLAERRRGDRHPFRDLARGPARLTQALGILDRAQNGADVCDPAGALRVEPGVAPEAELVRSGPRTGVGGDGAHQPWRLWIEGEPTVSPYRPHVPRRRQPAV
jgi:DNA-3-methyladenine glycosylase